MGLVLVEFVYYVEDEFKIKIPDADAEKIKTPGEFIDYLMSRKEVSEKWSRDYVSVVIWQFIENEIGDISKYDENSRFIEDMGIN